ncbi:ABC transporter permease [Virgibacillus pantothenticus]|uniref:ABC transporter permease n=1 Tax=Virgibacillus pantothenticus TaxID=1473 RepID=UPI003D2DF902
MIRVKNKKIIRKLARRNFRSSKVRNVFAVMAIALTTLLFTSLFTLGTGMIKSTQRADMVMSGGDGHARIENMTESEYRTIERHPLIQEMSYIRKLADSVDNAALTKRQTDFWYYDDLQLKYLFIELTSGHKPQEEKEIITDTKTLELLGIPQKLGTPLTLELTINNDKVIREFVLAGWWESHPGVPVGTIISSRAYMDAHLGELESTYRQDQSKTGSITGNLKFANSKNINEKLETVLIDSGFSMNINSQNYLNAGTNPIYLSKSTSAGFGTILLLSSILVLFMLTGYLIIFNIFQISVMRDIRFYGLLKTVGTTGRQLRAIIRRQAWGLSLVGIPLGLFGGFFVGRSMVPTLIEQSQLAGSKAVVSANPLIFVAAIMFTLATVFISIRKPLKMAAKISPVEAVSYTNTNSVSRKKKTKKSSNSGTPRRMALNNLGRNKKHTVLVILSLSLSIVLTNTIFNFSQSVDVDKALQNASDSDFRIGHIDLFNYKYKGKEESALSESLIAAVEKQEGFETGGRQYGSPATYKSETTRQTVNQRLDGSFSTNLIGLDEFSFSRLELLDGELDREKLATGKYILEGVWSDTRGNLDESSMNHSVGDQVKLNYGGNTIEVTVIGHIIANETNTYDWVGSGFFLPGEMYKKLTGNTHAMSYVFDVAEDEEGDMERFLKWYTNSIEPSMNYKSKLTITAGLTDIQDTIMLMGGTLALIIGIIGVLNFINIILTSVLIRRREFAVLRSIGMTKQQLLKMLCFEGGYYAAWTVAVSILLSIGSSLLIVRPLSAQIWFLTFHFNFWPLVIILPLIFVIGILIPYIIYHATKQQSIVEQLRIEGY